MKVIKPKKIKPMSCSILTTSDKYGDVTTQGGIIDTSKSGTMKEYQTVIAIGSMVRNVKVGDIICINPKNYAVKKYAKDSTKEAMVEHYNPVVGYNFNMVEVGDDMLLMITENDIDYIVEEYDEVEEEDFLIPQIPLNTKKETPKLLVPDTKIILP